MRIASFNTDVREGSTLPQRSLELLKRSLTVWPNVSIKWKYLDKLLDHSESREDGQSAISVSVLCLTILNVLLDYQLPNFVRQHITQFQQTLSPLMGTEHPKVVAAVGTMLAKLLAGVPAHRPERAAERSQFLPPDRRVNRHVAQEL
jgi:hypothetical protein